MGVRRPQRVRANPATGVDAVRQTNVPLAGLRRVVFVRWAFGGRICTPTGYFDRPTVPVLGYSQTVPYERVRLPVPGYSRTVRRGFRFWATPKRLPDLEDILL